MKTIIFGCGFTGTHLLKYFPDAHCTELPDLCNQNQIPFDFNNQTTWKNIPDFDQAIITFKMTDQLLAEKFSKVLSGKKIILLSSARNLVNTQPDEYISEKSSLSQNERSLAESYFRDFSTVLYLGLIWGGDRKPGKWLSQGRIKNGEKFINLIHVDDLCNIILYIQETEKTKNHLLVSDGKPIKWIELAERLGMTLACQKTGLESRRFDTSKLEATLPDGFQFQKT